MRAAVLLAVSAAAYGQAPSDAICARAERVALPLAAEDRPDAMTRASLARCDSTSLYYGFNGKPDYVKARQCAFLEWDKGGYAPLNGPGILMMIYANGLGVPRNLDMAQRFACKVSGAAPAEIEGRLAHLDSLRTAAGKIDICDDITSGLMSGYCAQVQARFRQRDREARFTALTARWPVAHRTAFGDLRLVFGQYAESHAFEEQDLSGTARRMIVISMREKLEDEFAAAVAGFEAGKLPRFTSAEFAAADARLNEVYLRVMSRKPGTRSTQRIWLRYREEWVRFGALHYPRVTEDSWKTWLTLARVKIFEELSKL